MISLTWKVSIALKAGKNAAQGRQQSNEFTWSNDCNLVSEVCSWLPGKRSKVLLSRFVVYMFKLSTLK